MAKKSNGRGGRKSWQHLSREVDRSAGLTPVKGAARKSAAVKAHASAKPRKGGKPKPPADPMDREVPVKLGAEAIKIREHELAEKILLRNRLVADLRDTSKAKRGEIEALNARINELAQICTDEVDNVRQGDLRFGQEVAGAAAVLGKAAKTIEETALTLAGEEALPGELHEFVPSGKREGDECELCGDDKRSLIHATKLEAHAYIPATEDDLSCGVCDNAGFVGSSDDAIHGAAALAAQGLKVAEEMPNGTGKDLAESLSRVVGGEDADAIVGGIKARRRRGKEASA